MPLELPIGHHTEPSRGQETDSEEDQRANDLEAVANDEIDEEVLDRHGGPPGSDVHGTDRGSRRLTVRRPPGERNHPDG
jgi:hypothetical protein